MKLPIVALACLYALTLNVARAENFVLCTEKNIPCFSVAPLISKSDELKADTVVVYTSSEGGLSSLKGPEKLVRSVQQLETQTNKGWQEVALGEVAANANPVIGFGGAFTDSTSVLLASLTNEKMEDDLVRAHFSLYDGIGYDLGRVPMAGSDFSCRKDGKPALTDCSKDSKDYYTYADVKTKDLSNFALAVEDTDYKIPLIRKALLQAKSTGSELKLFSSPWSAPVWMKEKHKDYKDPKSEVSLVHGKLKDDLETQTLWAEYFLKFFEAYRRLGIDFWATTIQNEPGREGFLGAKEMQWWQTMYFTPAEEAAFLKVLGPKLTQSDFHKIKVIVHDDQSSDIAERVHGIMGDKDAAKYVDGAGFHWYMNSDKNMLHVDEALHSLQDGGRKDRFVLSTEACAGYMPFGTKWKYTGWLAGQHQGGPLLGSWPRGEMYSVDIMGTMRHGSSGWTDWNMALDMKGGPNWAGNVVDAPVLVDYEKKQYYLQPMFFYLGHYSKFIRPGSRRVDVQSTGIPLIGPPMEAIAFEVPAYSIVNGGHSVQVPPTTVVVVMNRAHDSGRKYFIKTRGGRFINMDIGSKSIQTIVFKTGF